MANQPSFEDWFSGQGNGDDLVSDLFRRLERDAAAPRPWNFRALANHLDDRPEDLFSLVLAHWDHFRRFRLPSRLASLQTAASSPGKQEERTSMSVPLHDDPSPRRRLTTPRNGVASRRATESSGDRLLDVHEAAAKLGLKPSTLYEWAYERRIPVVKLGRALRFRFSVLEKLIKESERPALRGFDDREKAGF